MKKAFLTVGLISLISLPVNAAPRDKTITINLDNVSKSVINTIKPDSENLIKSEMDLTHLVAFVKNWKKSDSRKKQLLNLYSEVIPQAFKKYPNLKEFELSTYVNYTNKSLNKKQTKNLSKIIVTKEDLNKIDWKAVNVNNIKENKYIKQADFTDL